MRFTQLGMLVKSIDVPDVDATAVPATMLELTPATENVPVPSGSVSVLLVFVLGAAMVSVPVPPALPWSDIALIIFPLDN
jgi:hypothetical protein